MSNLMRTLLSLLILAILIGGPCVYALHRETVARGFHVVEPGVLYRSGQLPLRGLQRIVHDYNIRTIISLRDGEKEDDRAEEAYCRRWGINHVRIPPRSWWPTNGSAPVEKGLKVFREVMGDPVNYPVLIHCFAGIHRTGAYCAVYRMDFQRWSNDKALAEMRHCGYDTLDDERDLRTFLESYEPRPQPAIRPVSRIRKR